jgi:hypothetical protein
MSTYNSLKTQNIVRDYNKVQGTTHPADLSYQLIRDYNLRYITVQNSATRPVAFAITTYYNGPTPPIGSILEPGEIKHLGINSQGDSPQYIWLLGVQTSLPTGPVSLIRSNSNDLVIRDGLNIQWVHFYARPSYAASH